MQRFIIIVSGLPRSGTSLMMQILKAGGMALVVDDKRPADVNNPKGYFEFEAVKYLEEDNDWLENARGKVVKVISHQLKFLPTGFTYKTIFMHRNLTDIVESQNRMLKQLKKDSRRLSDTDLVGIYKTHIADTMLFLSRQNNHSIAEVHYESLIQNTSLEIKRIKKFINHSLNEESMQAVIDESLNHGRVKL